MFVSFFPRPRWFFASAALWSLAAVVLWFGFFRHLGVAIGLVPANAPPVIGVQMFWAPDFLWFDLYFLIASGLFSAFWLMAAPQRWWAWSVVGSILILYSTYLQVEVSVGVVRWYGPFWDLVQQLLDKKVRPDPGVFYGQIMVFLWLALVGVAGQALTQFFTSHYIFRWRTAMNDFYVSQWSRVRHIEGASQRVQEDTMNFAKTTEDLGLNFVNSVMTLVAFVPVLIGLSAHVTRLPLIGDVPYALLIVAIAWSAFGTGLLAAVGVKLPGLYFKNQRVEAAYRKELVYGEDDPDRARPPTLAELFANVRRNYFTLYFHYVYFNIARYLFLQADAVVSLVVLAPTILAGAITFGLLNQIMGAMDQVKSAFQYLVNSWSTIVDLQSIYKRLRSFEIEIQNEPLPEIERSLEPV